MPIRDTIIISIVLIAAFMALRRPWIGVMAWTWLSIMNPHRYTWAFAYNAPVAAIAGGATLVGLLFTKERRSPFIGAPVWWLFAFAIWVTLSWLFGMDVAGDYGQWNKVMKIYLMTFVALALLHSKHHIMAFAWVTIGSLAILAVKGGIFTVLSGGAHRVWGPASSFIQDNNEFALAVILTIPMLHFLQLQLSKAWMRHVMTAVILLSVASALGSHSRGAFLALGAMGVIFWWRSSKKGAITMMLLVVAVVLLPMMPEHWWERMGTIRTYQDDTSAMGRINAWYVAWDVAKDRFFGAGMFYQRQELFILYGRFEDTVRAAHSIYFQVLGNHGFGGLFLYLMIWISAFNTAGWLRRHGGKLPETQWVVPLGAMTQVCLIGYAAGGAFLSLAYFDLPYNVMVMVVLAKSWVLRRAWEKEPNVPFLEYAGLWRRKARPPGQQPSPTSDGATGPAMARVSGR
jgi:putative inorganic carbon (hco3(-)) transporter